MGKFKNILIGSINDGMADILFSADDAMAGNPATRHILAQRKNIMVEKSIINSLDK